jgi:YegS/Rv2252/BmrU family lipid kinase
VKATSGDFDRALYRSLTEIESPILDRIAQLLSQAADRSVVWLVTALALAVAGGQKGRVAAARGAASIGLASLLANTILKAVWRRPRPASGMPTVVRRPRSFSFPSGHTASAFAFATAVGSELPYLAVPLALGASAVGYSRIRGRVHYPSDVLAGAALGIAIGLLTRPVSSAVTTIQERARSRSSPARAGRSRAVLVVSPHASRVRRNLDRARQSLAASGADILEEVSIEAVTELPDMIRKHAAGVVVAAGGDGTVGAVAEQVANSQTALVVLPLGTSNDFARSLGIPMDVAAAARLIANGKVSTIDLGQFDRPGERPRTFVHAATVGLNVSFAKLATRASLRQRLGRLTYAVAAAVAFRDRKLFDCHLSHDGRTERLELAQLSVINAPIFGGFLGLRVRGSSPVDGLLDVLAAEDLPRRRTVGAGIYQLVRLKRPLTGVHAFQSAELVVDSSEALEVSLDGEVASRLPGRFSVAERALRVITPRDFKDTDA